MHASTSLIRTTTMHLSHVVVVVVVFFFFLWEWNTRELTNSRKMKKIIIKKKGENASKNTIKYSGLFS